MKNNTQDLPLFKMQDIAEGKLFILPEVGVLRKIHPIHGQSKSGKVYVIYPEDGVHKLPTRRG